MPIQSLADLLNHLGRVLDLAGLEPAADGTCLLSTGEDLLVQLSETPGDPPYLILMCDLGVLSEGHMTALAPVLLEANLGWQHTGGATLGSAADAGVVFLQQRERLSDLAPEHAEMLLQNFVAQCEKWREKLAAWQEAPPAAAEEPPGFSSFA